MGFIHRDIVYMSVDKRCPILSGKGWVGEGEAPDFTCLISCTWLHTQM